MENLGFTGDSDVPFNAQMTQNKVVHLTVKQQIAQRVRECELQLADAKRAEELLRKNPDLEELLNIMQRSHLLRY